MTEIETAAWVISTLDRDELAALRRDERRLPLRKDRRLIGRVIDAVEMAGKSLEGNPAIAEVNRKIEQAIIGTLTGKVAAKAEPPAEPTRCSTKTDVGFVVGWDRPKETEPLSSKEAMSASVPMIAFDGVDLAMLREGMETLRAVSSISHLQPYYTLKAAVEAIEAHRAERAEEPS